MATGDLDLTGQNQAYMARVSQQRDEVGAMYRASFNLLGYMKEMVDAAKGVASGDLTIQVEARSQHDQLGLAFAFDDQEHPAPGR